MIWLRDLAPSISSVRTPPLLTHLPMASGWLLVFSQKGMWEQRFRHSDGIMWVGVCVGSRLCLAFWCEWVDREAAKRPWGSG